LTATAPRRTPRARARHRSGPARQHRIRARRAQDRTPRGHWPLICLLVFVFAVGLVTVVNGQPRSYQILRKTVVLSFDDGPDATWTPRIGGKTWNLPSPRTRWPARPASALGHPGHGRLVQARGAAHRQRGDAARRGGRRHHVPRRRRRPVADRRRAPDHHRAAQGRGVPLRNHHGGAEAVSRRCPGDREPAPCRGDPGRGAADRRSRGRHPLDRADRDERPHGPATGAARRLRDGARPAGVLEQALDSAALAALPARRLGRHPGLQRGGRHRGVCQVHVLILVDGDTEFEPGTVERLVTPMRDPGIGAVGGNTKVANRRGFIGGWQHLEYVMGFNLDRAVRPALPALPDVLPGAAAPGRAGDRHRLAIRDRVPEQGCTSPSSG